VNIPNKLHVLWNIAGEYQTTAEVKPGTTVFRPFQYRISHLVVRDQIPYDCPVAQCPTSDNVMVSVNLSLSFRIVTPDLFVFNLGAVRCDELLKGGVEEGVRKLVRKREVKDVKALRGHQSGDLIDMLKIKFQNCGIDFTKVMITEVTLPENMQKALEATTQMNASLRSIDKQHAVDKSKTEKDLDIQLNALTRKNLQDKAEKGGEKQQAIIKADTDKTNMKEEAATKLAEAQVQVSVMKKNAMSEKERAKNNAERNRTQELNKAKDEAQKIKLRADEDLKGGVMDSVEELATAEREAKAITLDAEVENNLKEQVKMQRQHEFAIAQRKVLATLAEKGHYNLIGKTGDVMLKSMMEGDFNEKDFAALRS